ncbi:hypothetical protein ACTID9_02100 [Brevibacillus fluminis]|uniref:hypothetical protein n=1 Tax=Brevibacillus fluminis TaxID=511487 RepID=UPI003F8C8D5B
MSLSSGGNGDGGQISQPQQAGAIAVATATSNNTIKIDSNSSSNINSTGSLTALENQNIVGTVEHEFMETRPLGKMTIDALRTEGFFFYQFPSRYVPHIYCKPKTRCMVATCFYPTRFPRVCSY